MIAVAEVKSLRPHSRISPTSYTMRKSDLLLPPGHNWQCLPRFLYLASRLKCHIAYLAPL